MRENKSLDLSQDLSFHELSRHSNYSGLDRVMNILKNAHPTLIKNFELFPMSGNSIDSNEFLFYNSLTKELGVVKSPISSSRPIPIASERGYCRAGIRTEHHQLICLDEAPLQAFYLNGEKVDLQPETFRTVLETAKVESPYGYEIDFDSLFEYIALSATNLYLGTGYYGPLFMTSLETFISGKPHLVKIADCSYFEDLVVDNDLVSYADEKDVRVILGERATNWKLEGTIFRLFRRPLSSQVLKFIAITQDAICLRNFDCARFEWNNEIHEIPCQCYLQSFSFIYDDVLVAEKGEGEFVFIDTEHGTMKSAQLPGFKGLRYRNHFNRVLHDEDDGKLYFSMKEGTYVISYVQS